MSDLISLAKGVPALAIGLAVVAALLYASERLLALSGPLTKLVAAWHGRELARLRREALVRAEKRRQQLEEEGAVLADLRDQIRDLTVEVGRLRTVVRSRESHDRVMRDWADGLLRSARSAGLAYVDPPSTDETPAVTA